MNYEHNFIKILNMELNSIIYMTKISNKMLQYGMIDG